MPVSSFGKLCQAISILWDNKKVYRCLWIDVSAALCYISNNHRPTVGLQCQLSVTHLKASAVSSSYKIVDGICLLTILSNSVNSSASACFGALQHTIVQQLFGRHAGEPSDSRLLIAKLYPDLTDSCAALPSSLILLTKT